MATQNRSVVKTLVLFMLAMVALPIGTFFGFYDFLLVGGWGACAVCNSDCLGWQVACGVDKCTVAGVPKVGVDRLKCSTTTAADLESGGEGVRVRGREREADKRSKTLFRFRAACCL